MVRVSPGLPLGLCALRPGHVHPVRAGVPDRVTFGRDLTPKPPSHLRTVRVDSPWLDRLPAAARPQAQEHLDTMGRLLKELTEVYYSEWIRRFNEAKTAFQHLVARQIQGLPQGYDPRRAYRRLSLGGARPVTFDVTLSHPNLLENRNLRNLDLGGIRLRSADGLPVSMRQARLQKANLTDFLAVPGLDLRGAEYDRETRLFHGPRPKRAGMVLAAKGYEKGPWMAYANLFEEWPRGVAGRVRRWWGLRGQH